MSVWMGRWKLFETFSDVDGAAVKLLIDIFSFVITGEEFNLKK